MGRSIRRSSIGPALVATSFVCGGASCIDFGSLSSAASGDDAATDATSGSGDSGAIDAGASDSPSGPTTFCASHPGHTICDDFDDVDYLAPWNEPEIETSDATIGQDPLAFVSAPYSLDTEIPESPDAASVAFVQTKFASIPSWFRIELDFQLVAGGTSTVSIANVLLPNNVSYTMRLASPSPPILQLVEVTRNDAGAAVYQSLPGVSYVVEIGRWYHVVVQLGLRGADAGEVDVTFADASTSVEQAPSAFSFEPSSTFQLQTGVSSFSAAPFHASSVRIDNYVVDTE